MNTKLLELTLDN